MARNVVKPLTVNMGFGIRQRPTTPLLSTKQLEDMGVKAVSFPRMLTAAAIQGMKNALAVLGQSIEEGRVIDRPDLLVSFDELNDLMGLRRDPRARTLVRRAGGDLSANVRRAHAEFVRNAAQADDETCGSTVSRRWATRSA